MLTKALQVQWLHTVNRSLLYLDSTQQTTLPAIPAVPATQSGKKSSATPGRAPIHICERTSPATPSGAATQGRKETTSNPRGRGSSGIILIILYSGSSDKLTTFMVVGGGTEDEEPGYETLMEGMKGMMSGM